MSLPLFLIPILCGLLAQALKPILNHQWYATLSPGGKQLPRYGGMPSAHAATATSLVVVIARFDGLSSTTFLLAIIILIWTIDDALRMRIFLSRYGQALAQLVARLPAAEQQQYPYVESRLGHRPSEVAAGSLLGFVAASLLLFFLGA